MEDENIRREISEKSVDGEIACAQCFVIARNYGVAVKDVGAACNELSIKIRQCQLGCF